MFPFPQGFAILESSCRPILLPASDPLGRIDPLRFRPIYPPPFYLRPANLRRLLCSKTPRPTRFEAESPARIAGTIFRQKSPYGLQPTTPTSLATRV